MAITGNASYISTTNEFIAHWESVNADLGVGNEVTVAGGVGVADLTTLRDSLQAQRDAVEGALNGQEIASATIKLKKQGLLERFAQLAANVRALFGGQPFEAALPDAPGVSDAESKFLKPMVDAHNLWTRITTAGTVITLVGGYNDEAFNSDIAALRADYVTWTKAGSDLKIARAQRDELQGQIYPVLKQYRQIIPGKFAAGSVFIETLPRLTPKPGATPKAVNASAVWDAGEAKASLTWDESTNADLKEYEVRYTPGDEYREEDELVVANIAPGADRELLTDAGLTQPGASASFKVYVILTTGNERGSVAMTVTRPES